MSSQISSMDQNYLSNGDLERQMYMIRGLMDHQKKRMKICQSMLIKNNTFMKVYFKKWCNDLLGKNHMVALFNYAKFHNLNKLPNYTDVANSSAGIEGWGKQMKWKPHCWL